MKLIKSFALAVATALFTVTPSLARVDAGTSSLLEAARDNGITILVNSRECQLDNIHGSYQTIAMRRRIVLCPGETADAIDHATVRHEMAHSIQHCVNQARGTSRDTPIIRDMDALARFVNEGVPEETIRFIKANYPQHQWLVEFEANYIELNMTAAEVEAMFRKACGGER